ERRTSPPRAIHTRRGRGRLHPGRRARRHLTVRAASRAAPGRGARSIPRRGVRDAEAGARASVHPLVRHRSGVESDAGGQHRLLPRLLQRGGRRASNGRATGGNGAGGRRVGAGAGQAMFAIRDLSFDVRDGELLTIVGPSGSGKSTLLNLIAQIDAPTEGEIRFRGEAIAGPNMRALRPGWDRQFGYVTQDDTLLPWRTLRDNVLFPLRVQGRLSAP